MKKLIVGNWKMNGLRQSAASLVDGILTGVAGGAARDAADVVLCPPATLLAATVEQVGGSAVAVGAQDCHFAASGAFTGDVSAEMIADSGARYVILGHSERRGGHGESDQAVRAKVETALAGGLIPIVCVGESAEQRRAGEALEVIEHQLSASLPDLGEGQTLVVAYEPIWAIGTGDSATPADVATVHAFIREELAARFEEAGSRMRILYGGSVKPDNAAELLATDNVDGALVGGASLKPEDFLGIIAAAAGAAVAAA